MTEKNGALRGRTTNDLTSRRPLIPLISGKPLRHNGEKSLTALERREIY